MNQINAFISRAQVLARAAVTWLITAQVVIQVIITEIGSDVPVVAQYGAQALALIAGAILVVRRVSPVADADQGLL